MKKSDAVNLFGGKQVYLAKALKRTKGAICNWDDELHFDAEIMVLGAAVKYGIPIPKHLIEKQQL